MAEKKTGPALTSRKESLSVSSPTAANMRGSGDPARPSAQGHVSGVCNCLRAEIPAAYNGAPCAEASLQPRWSVGG